MPGSATGNVVTQFSDGDDYDDVDVYSGPQLLSDVAAVHRLSVDDERLPRPQHGRRVLPGRVYRRQQVRVCRPHLQREPAAVLDPRERRPPQTGGQSRRVQPVRARATVHNFEL